MSIPPRPQRPKPPWWQGPWRDGVYGGRAFRAFTIARTRAERNTKGVDVIIFTDELMAMDEQERGEYLAASFIAALKEIGLVKPDEPSNTPEEPVSAA